MSPTPSASDQSPRQTPPHAPPATHTHILLGILVGAGIQQQPHAVRVSILSGINQRRPSALRTRLNVPTCEHSAAQPPRECNQAHADTQVQVLKQI